MPALAGHLTVNPEKRRPSPSCVGFNVPAARLCPLASSTFSRRRITPSPAPP